MGQLLACPFCRELYSADDASRCPACEVELVPLGSLPLSADALPEVALDTEVIQPDDVRFGILHLGHGRGPLIGLAVLGLICFFAPWLVLQEPDAAVISGYQIAHTRSGWFWGGALAFFMLIPLLITRRCPYDLRGVRIISATFAVMTLLEACLLFLKPPTAGPFVRVTYAWGWGLFASASVSAVALLVATRLGGAAPRVKIKSGEEPRAKPAVDRNKNLKLH